MKSPAPEGQGSTTESVAQPPGEPAEPPNLQHVGAASVGLPNEVAMEEGSGAYKPGHFHPVYTGDTFNGKYLVLNKLGYGLYSTVWLVRDISSP